MINKRDLIYKITEYGEYKKNLGSLEYSNNLELIKEITDKKDNMLSDIIDIIEKI